VKSRTTKLRCIACFVLFGIFGDAWSSEESVLDKYRSRIELSNIAITRSRGDLGSNKCRYVVVVSGKGDVAYRIYDGDAKGRREAGEIDNESVVALVNGFLAAHFFDLPDYRRTYEIETLNVHSETIDPAAGSVKRSSYPMFYIRPHRRGAAEVTLELRIGADSKTVHYEAGKHKELDDLASDIDAAVRVDDHIRNPGCRT
jgi:hypothetical protein